MRMDGNLPFPVIPQMRHHAGQGNNICEITAHGA